MLVVEIKGARKNRKLKYVAMNRNFDIEKVTAAIEADAGQALPEIRQALGEVKHRAQGARVHTSEQMLLRQALQKFRRRISCHLND